MGLQGYVGSAEDQRRIRRQEKEREDRKKQFEDKKKRSDANVDAAGLRQFGAGTSEVLQCLHSCFCMCICLQKSTLTCLSRHGLQMQRDMLCICQHACSNETHFLDRRLLLHHLRAFCIAGG